MKEIEKYLGLKYPITLYEAPEGGFVTEIEELPGCLAEGETLEEAIDNIKEAIKLYLETKSETLNDEEETCQKQFLIPIKVSYA